MRGYAWREGDGKAIDLGPMRECGGGDGVMSTYVMSHALSQSKSKREDSRGGIREMGSAFSSEILHESGEYDKITSGDNQYGLEIQEIGTDSYSLNGKNNFFKIHKLCGENVKDETDYDYCIVSRSGKSPEDEDDAGGMSSTSYGCSSCYGGNESPPEMDRHEHDKIIYDEFGKIVVERLKKLGFVIFSFYSSTREEIFTVVKVPTDVLKHFAASQFFSMILDPCVIRRECSSGDRENNIDSIYINQDKEYSPIVAFDYIYARYSSRVQQELYWHPTTESTHDNDDSTENPDLYSDEYFRSRDVASPFRELVRLQLIGMLVESRQSGETGALTMHKYLAEGKILSCFALHDRHKSSYIMDQWFNWKIVFTYFTYGKHMKYIREYFGEKICLYFRFVQHYSKWLIGLCIGGIIVESIGLGLLKVSARVTLPFFSLLVNLWGILMLEFWKRNEKVDALFWGQLEFKDHEGDIPEFKGELIKSYVDGSEMMYSSPFWKSCRVYFSSKWVYLILRKSNVLFNEDIILHV